MFTNKNNYTIVVNSAQFLVVIGERRKLKFNNYTDR